MIENLFSLKGKNSVIIGGAGGLGSSIAKGLGLAGSKIAICDISIEKAQNLVEKFKIENIESYAYEIDVFNKDSILNCAEKVIKRFGRIDILINGVGGNLKEATTSETLSFFDIPLSSIEKVISLNLLGGAILPSQIFGKYMIKNENGGSIINISSMNAIRPLTKIFGYSAAKAAVSNFTQWLAVHLAQEYNYKIRVNAIAPGFILTDQNRFLLIEENSGELTERGKRIIEHTPQKRFGSPEDLIGAVIWLASDSSSFVTGAIIPIDGGFSAYSGV